MKITILENATAYREVAPGEVIEKGGKYYMKTTLKNYDGDGDYETFEAVELSTGETEAIEPKELVWRVNAELMIKQ